MPSSENYVRNYQREAETGKARGDDKRNALRHKSRRLATKKGLVKPNDGKDIDHKRMLSKGGGIGLANIRVATPKDNRSFARNADGSAKNNK